MAKKKKIRAKEKTMPDGYKHFTASIEHRRDLITVPEPGMMMHYVSGYSTLIIKLPNLHIKIRAKNEDIEYISD